VVLGTPLRDRNLLCSHYALSCCQSLGTFEVTEGGGGGGVRNMMTREMEGNKWCDMECKEMLSSS
jgi:hypothetical protein